MDHLNDCPLYQLTDSNPSGPQPRLSGGDQLNKNMVTLPVKKLKNKKLAQKVRKLKDFCSNVLSYIETLSFKVGVKVHKDEKEIQTLVERIITNGDSVKITSVKLIYIHLRENCLYPHCKSY